MHPSRRPSRRGPNRLADCRTKSSRRRSAALNQILHGACYAIGTGLIGLAFLWAERFW
ncbi:hypothetical protein E0500_028140 [Streptomyces sp. KM273126]|uniref:hypothetical protein n=1 Tax=Streptomyces sp. KM273126 TaxID=2545247 RepID=UPI001405316B|nr:hypothetical protein [Streptomyces sp. KM273126]MBA2811169.1 hypothetical protein [Streptomyces sp. KM273126]